MKAKSTYTPKLSAGDEVMVYQDPLSRQMPEGKATLLAFRSFKGFFNGAALERWTVRFDSDGDTFSRSILVVPEDDQVPVTLLHACERVVRLFRDKSLSNTALAQAIGDAIEGVDPWLSNAIARAKSSADPDPHAVGSSEEPVEVITDLIPCDRCEREVMRHVSLEWGDGELLCKPCYVELMAQQDSTGEQEMWGDAGRPGRVL